MTPARFCWFAVVSMIVGLACSSPAPPAPASPTAAPAAKAPEIDIDDPADCEDCHEVVVAEWRESMHARAHHSRDPIFDGVRRLRLGKEGPEVAGACALCHSPRGGDDHDGAVARVGVGCAACHNLAAVHEAPDKKGRQAFEYAAGTLLVGPHDVAPGAEDAHATGPAPAHMRDAAILCLACHGELRNPAGIPICTTGPEAAKGKGREQGCPSCHMARVKGASGGASERADHASHAFAGPHRAWYQNDTSVFERALEVKVGFSDSALDITLENKTGHAFPTGFPGRVIVLQVLAHDDNGNEVAQAWFDDPLIERPEVVLNKAYADAERRPTLAPYAVELGRDTRLLPNEKRTIRLPTEDVAQRAQVSAHAYLLSAWMAATIGVADIPEAEPKQVITVEVKRKD